MKYFLAVALGIVMVAGCGDNGRMEENGNTATGDSVRSDSGMGQGHNGGGMHGGEMTQTMDEDMGTMNQKMVQALGPADSTYDRRFIDMMIPHHEGALAMAKDALGKATKGELREMAKAMVESQQKEIDRMRDLRSQWYGTSGADGGNAMISQMIAMNQHMVQELGTSDADYEHRFIDMMIPHHEGALLMARDALGKAQHPELKELARAIIQEQEREIAQMNTWRSEWYGH